MLKFMANLAKKKLTLDEIAAKVSLPRKTLVGRRFNSAIFDATRAAACLWLASVTNDVSAQLLLYAVTGWCGLFATLNTLSGTFYALMNEDHFEAYTAKLAAVFADDTD